MDTPKDAYEEAIEKMAKAAWDYGERENRTPEAWDDLEDVWHKTYRAEARAAAEAIGLREMMEDAACWRRLFRAREDESSSSYAGQKRP